jgi:hypothetical protein
VNEKVLGEYLDEKSMKKKLVDQMTSNKMFFFNQVFVSRSFYHYQFDQIERLTSFDGKALDHNLFYKGSQIKSCYM